MRHLKYSQRLIPPLITDNEIETHKKLLYEAIDKGNPKEILTHSKIIDDLLFKKFYSNN